MFSLLEALYNILTVVTEDMYNQCPKELLPELNSLCIKLGAYLDRVNND